MENETVYRFKKYDIGSDEFVVSTRMATLHCIRRLGAEVVDGTETLVDARFVTEGWTAKNFDPTFAPPRPAGFQTQIR